MAVQIILKNSSVEDKRPQASQLTNGEISLNYSSAGAFLCCTDTNGDVQQVGGVKIDETAPDAPVKQTLWFKPSTLTLSVYDGDKWLPIAGGGGGGGGGGDIIQIIGNDGIDADTVAGIVTLDVELAGGDDGLEFKSSKLSATLASATDLGSVKVGDNINVTAGKISVPKATSSTFGVVKLGDGIEIDGDGSISIDVPTTTTYRGSCDLNNPPTGQINPDPALKGDAYINSADAAAVDAGWTGITGSAKIGDLVIFDGTTWDLIPLGAGTAPVTSVNGKTGDVVLDYTDVGAASEAQGDLADTALQPGDNISELNNDEGYITEAEAPVQSVNGKTGVVVLDAADVGALAPGDNVSELDNDAGYITLAEVPAQKPPVISSATAPTGDDAVEGNLWFNSNDGRTYVYYKDGDSSQWVDASPDSGGAGGTVGDYWLEAGGYLSPKTGTNGVDIGGSKIQLNTDGSITAAGNIEAVGNVFSGEKTADGDGISLRAFGALYVRQDGATNNAFNIYNGGGSNTAIKATIMNDGSSQFAGDMAIGVTGSFTPSTPAIKLDAAEGYVLATAAYLTSPRTGPGWNSFGIRENNGNKTLNIFSDGTLNIGPDLNGAISGDNENITLKPDGTGKFIPDKTNNTYFQIDTDIFGKGISAYSNNEGEGSVPLGAGFSGSLMEFTNHPDDYTNINTVMHQLRHNFSGNLVQGAINFYRGVATSGGYLGFQTDGTEKAQITATGSLIIGTTGAYTPSTPAITLKPDGGASFNEEVYSYRAGTGTQSIMQWSSDEGGTKSQVAKVMRNGRFAALNTTIQSITSERRLKENIVPIDSGIAWETIKSTPYYAYNFIGAPAESVCYGPMADEVPTEMVVQSMEENEAGVMVTRTDDAGPIRTFDNGMLQARLYTALQAALTRIEELEARLDAAGV